jgi:hypothetical protein
MSLSISQWLSGNRNYEQGIELFEKNKGSQVLVTMFRKRKNSFTIEKLATELQKLIARNTDNEFSNTITDKSRQTTFRDSSEKSPIVPPGEVSLNSEKGLIIPPEIQEFIVERKKLYRSRDYMKSKLIVSDDETRRRYCLMIMQHTYRVGVLWDIQEHFKATGEVVDFSDKTFFEKRQADLGKQITNARSNVSKHKKRGNKEKQKLFHEKLEELIKRRDNAV